MLVTCLKRVGFFFRKGNVTSRHEPATLISWSLPRLRDVTPYRSPGCADVLRVARADVTDFSYMTLMDTSAVKHNMLKIPVGTRFSARPDRPWGPPSLLYNECQVFTGGRGGRCVGRTPPSPSSAEVLERIELYRYSP